MSVARPAAVRTADQSSGSRSDEERTPQDRIDTLTVDWDRVKRACYRVRVHYRYTYSGAITDLQQRLVVIPADQHLDQRLTAHHLEVRGASRPPAIRWEQDRFGNRVARLSVAEVEHAIDFEARYLLERVGGVVSAPRLTASALRMLLQPTALTAPDARLRAAASEIAAATDDPAERAERAHDWSASAIGYQFGITGYQTPAAMALHLGKGVCQDYAHILLSLLRLLGIAARYVSGHLLGEGAPHAWVEALIENQRDPGAIRVVAFDPTHRRRANLGYFTVAVGRDYADVTPTSGTFSGAASGKLSYAKQAEVVELAYPGDPEATEPAA